MFQRLSRTEISSRKFRSLNLCNTRYPDGSEPLDSVTNSQQPNNITPDGLTRAITRSVATKLLPILFTNCAKHISVFDGVASFRHFKTKPTRNLNPIVLNDFATKRALKLSNI